MSVDLPPLRDVIARYGLNASKALGQNFLFDGQLLARIAAVPGDLTDAEVLEVGPGPGGVGDGGVLLIHRSDPAVGLCHRVAEQLAAPNQPALPHSGIDGENQTSSRQSRTAPHP